MSETTASNRRRSKHPNHELFHQQYLREARSRILQTCSLQQEANNHFKGNSDGSQACSAQ